MFANVEWVKRNGDRYKWTGTMALFGFFVDYSSEKLGIRHEYTGNIPWQVYQAAFGLDDANIATAKQAVNGYSNKNLPKPRGHKDIITACNKRT